MINKYGDMNKLIDITYEICSDETLFLKPICDRCGYSVEFVWKFEYENGYIEQICNDCLLEEEIRCINNKINM